jgi:cellulose synthase/poly-beta-1,6-N-acetylglucosamine synthase-like glycosyltransferase
MLIYFSIIFSIYYIFTLALLYGWSRSFTHKNGQALGDSDLFISVIVAVRNESENIIRLLSALESQCFPKKYFEVIVVDDGSEDDTIEVIQNFKNTCTINLQLAGIDAERLQCTTPKKAALTAGIAKAQGSIIVTTDGDCWMGKYWLNSLVSGFQDPKTMFVSGPVAIEQGSNLFSRIQSLEFSSLIGSGGALIRLNYPLMCNGANLAFRKEAFEAVGGYDGVSQHASGDDVFLMQKIHANYLGGVAFVKDSKAIVFTRPALTIRELMMQRRRWAAKWNTYSLKLSWILPVFLFVLYLSFLLLVVLPVVRPKLLSMSVFFIAVKFILDFFFLKNVMKFCNLRMGYMVFLITELIYPLYALLIGTIVHFGKWTWKGRKHKT